MVLAKGDKPKGWGLMRDSSVWWTAGSRLALFASSSVFGLTAIGGGPVVRADEPELPPPKTYAVSGAKGSVAYNPAGIGGGNGQNGYRNGGNAGFGPQLTVNFSGAEVAGQNDRSHRVDFVDRWQRRQWLQPGWLQWRQWGTAAAGVLSRSRWTP